MDDHDHEQRPQAACRAAACRSALDRDRQRVCGARRCTASGSAARAACAATARARASERATLQGRSMNARRVHQRFSFYPYHVFYFLALGESPFSQKKAFEARRTRDDRGRTLRSSHPARGPPPPTCAASHVRPPSIATTGLLCNRHSCASMRGRAAMPMPTVVVAGCSH